MSHKPAQMKKDQEYRELLEEQLRLRDRVFSCQEKMRDALAELNIALDELSTSDKRILQVYADLEESVDQSEVGPTSEMIEDYQFPQPTPKLPGLSSRWISNKKRYLPPPTSTKQVEPYITADDIAWCSGWSSEQTQRLMNHLSEADPTTFKK